MGGLRTWARDEVAPDDATREELALHWTVHGDVFIRTPAVSETDGPKVKRRWPFKKAN